MSTNKKILEGNFINLDKEALRNDRLRTAEHVIDMAEQALEIELTTNGESQRADKIRDKIDRLKRMIKDKHYEDQYDEVGAGEESASNSENSEANGAKDTKDTTNKSNEPDKSDNDNGKADSSTNDDNNAGKASSAKTNETNEDDIPGGIADKTSENSNNDSNNDSNNTDNDKSNNRANNQQSGETPKNSPQTSAADNNTTDQTKEEEQGNNQSDIGNGTDDTNSTDNQEENTESDNQDQGGTKDNKASSQDNQDTSGQSKNSQTKAIKDIFDMSDDEDDGNGGGGMPEEPEDPSMEDIKKMLASLDPISKNGAIDALKDILNTRKTTNESLNEVFNIDSDEIEDIPENDFNKEINDCLDLIQSIVDIKTKVVTEDELKKTIADLTDPLAIDELSTEDKLRIQQSNMAKKAREKEILKYNSIADLPGMEAFRKSLQHVITTQIKPLIKQDQSWGALNRRYTNTTILKKGDTYGTQPTKSVPVIDIYLDQSASWGNYKNKGSEVVGMLKTFVDKQLIKVNLFYFGNHVKTINDPKLLGSGTGAWKEIIDNIAATKATNVVLITDTDMEQTRWDHNATKDPGITVPGCVWIIWKEQASKVIASKLRGRMNGNAGNMQFNIDKA